MNNPEIQLPANLEQRFDSRRPRVQSAVRTVQIILAVAQSSNGLKAKEISEQLALPRQVVYHLVYTLLGTGILRKNERNRYVLGLAAAVIADGFRRQLAAPEHLAPLVRAAVAATGETAYAGGWIDGKIAVLAAARGQNPVQAAELPHGYSGHAHARAAGKLLLASASPAVLDEYLASNPLVALTSRTITTRDELLRELETIRQQGYAIDNEEFSPGLCCLAVPVEGMGSHYALGISVPAERFQTNVNRYLVALRGAATRASPS